jgi:4a-hydroxytetrahydrobiopterin dehydratase
MELIYKKCEPCEGGVDPLNKKQANELMHRIHTDWKLNGNKIERLVTYVNFKQNMDVVNKIAQIAEEEGHHPDLYISYARLNIEITTHAIKGLSENDFILAAKLDKIL